MLGAQVATVSPYNVQSCHEHPSVYFCIMTIHLHMSACKLLYTPVLWIAFCICLIYVYLSIYVYLCVYICIMNILLYTPILLVPLCICLYYHLHLFTWHKEHGVGKKVVLFCFVFVILKLENLKLGELYINQTYGEHQDFAKQFWSIVSRGLGERYLSSMFAYLDGTFFCLSFRTQTIQIYFILEEIQMKKKVQALFLIWWLTPNIHKEYTWVEKGFLPRTLQGKWQLGREQGQQLQ